jgi:hypothetical protein
MTEKNGAVRVDPFRAYERFENRSGACLGSRERERLDIVAVAGKVEQIGPQAGSGHRDSNGRHCAAVRAQSVQHNDAADKTSIGRRFDYGGGNAASSGGDNHGPLWQSRVPDNCHSDEQKQCAKNGSYNVPGLQIALRGANVARVRIIFR